MNKEQRRYLTMTKGHLIWRFTGDKPNGYKFIGIYTKPTKEKEE